MTHRPTSLALALRHCPHAIDLMRAGTPRIDEEIFQAGIAAHAILERIGRETWKRREVLKLRTMERLADQVVKVLVSEGRVFEGHQEDPIHPQSAGEGRKLVLDYLALRPLDPAGLDVDQFEVGLAVDDAWEPSLYDGAWLHHITDRLSVWTEESGQRVVEVRDYKSAWPTGPKDLDTLQRKIAVCLAHAAYPDADLYRRSVVNLRTCELFSAETAAEAADEWRDMRAEIQAAIWYVGGALRPDGSHKAIPGARCYGCSYVLKCDYALHWIEAATAAPFHTPELQAEAFAAAEAIREALAPLLKRAAAETGRVDFQGGSVGWTMGVSRWANDDAYAEVADEAELCGMDLRSTLKALSLTKSNLKRFAQVAPTLDTPKRRAEWIDPLTHEKPKRGFGVLREQEAEE